MILTDYKETREEETEKVGEKKECVGERKVGGLCSPKQQLH